MFIFDFPIQKRIKVEWNALEATSTLKVQPRLKDQIIKRVTIFTLTFNRRRINIILQIQVVTIIIKFLFSKFDILNLMAKTWFYLVHVHAYLAPGKRRSFDQNINFQPINKANLHIYCMIQLLYFLPFFMSRFVDDWIFIFNSS